MKPLPSNSASIQQVREAIVRENGAYAQAVRPSPRLIAAVLACFLLPVSLIPASSVDIFFHLPFLPVAWWSTNLIVLFCGIVLLLRPILGFSRAGSKATLRWFLWPFMMLAVWQIVSLAWNDRVGDLKSYSLLESIAMASAVASGILLTSGMSFAGRIRLGSIVTMMLAVVFLVYMGLSFVFPGLRPSHESIDRIESNLGFIRMFGPLGKATTLLFILLPLMGFSMGMLFIPGRSKAFWFVMTAFFLIATLVTGSRGALVCLATFLVCLILSLRLRAAWLLLLPAFILPLLLLFTGVPERYRIFEDRARIESYKTALRAYSSSPSNMLLGVGHGNLYSVLHDNTERKLLLKDRWHLLTETNKFGFTLRSSHTAILRTLTESGPIGFVCLVIAFSWIVKRLLLPKSRIGGDPYGLHASCILSGCVAVIPYMALDEFFVNGYWVVLLWCFFVVNGAESQRDADCAREFAGLHHTEANTFQRRWPMTQK